MNRRSLLAFLLPGVALAQGPQINATTQMKNLPAPPATGPFDNWVPVTFTGAVNGTNATFTLAAGAWRKIEVYLNGQFCYQAAQTSPSNYSWSNANQPQAITFTSPLPQPAGASGSNLAADAIFIRGTL